MGCVTEAIKGGGGYTILSMIRHAPGPSLAFFVLGTLLFAWIVVRTKKALVPFWRIITCKPPNAKKWYMTLVCLPMCGAIAAWLTIVAPGIAMIFEAVYAFYEAVAIVFFAFIILELRKKMNDDMSEALVPGAADKEEKRIRCTMRFIYQFTIVNPTMVLIMGLCELSGESSTGDTLYNLANGIRILSTVTAVLNLVCMLHRFYAILPSNTNCASKFLAIKGIIVLGIVQSVVIGLIIRCGGMYTIFRKDEAQNVWQAFIFLLELPFLQALYAKVFPAVDLERHFNDLGAISASASGEVMMNRSESHVDGLP